MNYVGDYAEDATVRVFFTTHDQSGGVIAPLSAFESSDIRIYKGSSATEKTTTNGVTMTSPFDSVTGLHLVVIDTSVDTGDVGFWTVGADYTVVLVPDETVDSQTVAKVLAHFSIHNRSGVKEHYTTRVAMTTRGLTPTADQIDSGHTFVNPLTDTAFDVNNGDRFRIGDILSPQGSREILRVTAISGDELTVERSHDNTPAETLTPGERLLIVGSLLQDQLLVSARIATVTSQTQFTLASGSDHDNAYKGCIVVIQGGTPATSGVRRAVGICSAYTGASRTLTLLADPSSMAITVGQVVDIFAMRADHLADLVRSEMDSDSSQLAAIKAKTDNLPTDPADQSLIIAATTAIASLLTDGTNGLAALDADLDTLLSRLTAGRAGNLDNLDAPISVARDAILTEGGDGPWGGSGGDCPSLDEIVAALAGSTITVVSAGGFNGKTLTLNRGEAYLNSINNAILIQNITHPSFSIPMETDGTTVAMKLVKRFGTDAPIELEGVITDVTSEGVASFRFDMTAVESGALTPGDNTYRFDVEIEMQGDPDQAVTPIIDGQVNVRADIE